VIAEVLQENFGFEVKIVNLRDSTPDLSGYEKIIVGSGVRMQRLHKESSRFIEKNNFKDKTVAFFLSTLEPGEEAYSKYIKPLFEKQETFKPVEVEVFGGRMRVLSKTVTDKREVERVKAWAEKLGEKLKS
jgi:menaquinone-dependent protoporphyrinogen IX oxidase